MLNIFVAMLLFWIILGPMALFLLLLRWGLGMDERIESLEKKLE